MQSSHLFLFFDYMRIDWDFIFMPLPLTHKTQI